LPRLLQRLLDLILNLPTQRLQRLVNLALDLVAGQLERLFHLLAHSLSDLTLQLAEDRLDGLTDLLLQCLTQVQIVGISRCSPIIAVPGRTVAALRPVAPARLSILSPGVGLSGAPAPLRAALTVVGSRITLSRLPSRLVLILRLPCPSCLFDSHHASLLYGDSRLVSMGHIRGQISSHLMVESVGRTRRPLRPEFSCCGHTCIGKGRASN
jgi:hypothetical protein